VKQRFFPSGPAHQKAPAQAEQKKARCVGGRAFTAIYAPAKRRIDFVVVWVKWSSWGRLFQGRLLLLLEKKFRLLRFAAVVDGKEGKLIVEEVGCFSILFIARIIAHRYQKSRRERGLVCRLRPSF
jgi:hypothetical protein